MEVKASSAKPWRSLAMMFAVAGAMRSGRLDLQSSMSPGCQLVSSKMVVVTGSTTRSAR